MATSPDVKLRLRKVLDQVEYSGSFLTAQYARHGVNPGLHIPDVGQIRLPVSCDDAKTIIKACHESPFGKGSETVVDNSVRKTWELDKDQFSLENPWWKDEVQRLVRLTVEGLGLHANPADVVAERYKLLLYEEGAFFLPHQDSPKEEGMFGTLVISLPSKHTGGDLVASHKNEHQVYKSSSVSEYEYSSAAWYSDITHEVKPVTSGYRIVLTYNLIHRPTAELLGVRDNISAQIISALNDWQTTCNEAYQKSEKPLEWQGSYGVPTSLLLMMDHKYHSAGLGFTQLKGEDQVKVSELRRACKEKGFSLYLANVTKQVTGESEEDYGFGHYSSGSKIQHPISYETDSSIDLTTVVDCDGHVVADNVSVTESFFIEDDPFGDEPDEEEYEGFTGNAGASATHIYRKTVALVIPPTFLSAFIVHALQGRGCGNVDLRRFIQQIFADVPNQSQNKQASDGLIRIARAIIAKRSRMGYRGHLIRSDAKAKYCDVLGPWLLKIGSLEPYKELIESREGELSPSISQGIAAAIQKHGFDKIRPSLDTTFNSEASTAVKLEILCNIVSDHLKLNNMTKLNPAEPLTEWHETTLSRVLSNPQDLDHEAGQKLVNLVEDYPTENILERTLPLVEKSASESSFILGFLTSLCEASKRGKLAGTDVSKVFSATLPKLLGAFTFERPPRFDPYQSVYTVGAARALIKDGNEPNPFCPQSLALLIRQCDALSVDRDAILETLGKRGAALPESQVEDVFERVLLPFIRELCLYLNGLRAENTIETKEKDFIFQTVQSYIMKHVRPKPQPPADRARDIPITCRCGDCCSLISFVRDPLRQTKGFAMAVRRRQHLQYSLDYTFHTTTIANGIPHTLQVTKTTKQFDQDCADWKKRRQSAKVWLSKLAKEAKLVEIVGKGSFEELCLLADTGSNTPLPVSRTAQALNADASATTIPRKRSFVDLT
ncbi:hypothetical protein FQN54_006890 [Arachnomyces sp. PD_36]|nr:hypothetical protein FQN54_006890 [Arachnomyces sp. PD_36]